MPTTPDNATDATTIGESLAHFEARGFTTQMAAREGGMVFCAACREEVPAGEVVIEALIRTEGASDPDDMVAVAALTCPRCDAKGTVALAYGPESAPEEMAVLVALDDRRKETGITPD